MGQNFNPAPRGGTGMDLDFLNQPHAAKEDNFVSYRPIPPKFTISVVKHFDFVPVYIPAILELFQPYPISRYRTGTNQWPKPSYVLISDMQWTTTPKLCWDCEKRLKALQKRVLWDLKSIGRTEEEWNPNNLTCESGKARKARWNLEHMKKSERLVYFWFYQPIVFKS